MSSTLGTIASTWAPTTPLPPSIPARPVLAEAAIKRGRGGRPSSTSTWGGNRRRGRGGIASSTSGTTNGTTGVRGMTSDVGSNPTIVSSGHTPLSPNTLPSSLPPRPPRPVPVQKRPKSSVPKVDVITKTESATLELTPMRSSRRRRGRASPRASSVPTASKPSGPADTSEPLVPVPEPSKDSFAATEPLRERDAPSSIAENSSIPPILDLPTTRPGAMSLTLPSPNDSTHRPNTPSTHSHIDWADDDDADLPNLDDWGFASKPTRRRSSEVEPPIITTTLIPPVSVDIVTSPTEGAPPSSPSVPCPDDNPNGDVVEPSAPKPKGRPPFDPARVAEKKKLRNERAKERWKKKADGAALVDARPNPGGSTAVVLPLPHASKEPIAKTRDTPRPLIPPASTADEVTKPKTSPESATVFVTSPTGKSTESRETRERIPSSAPLASEVQQGTSDTSHRQKPDSATLLVPILPHTATAPESKSTSTSPNTASASSRPSSSSHETSPQGGAPGSRHSPSPTKLHTNGRYTHTHSHSMARPIISPNALSQLTKSLSGGSRQHRSAVSAE